MNFGNLIQRLWARYLIILFISLTLVQVAIYFLLEPYVFGGWRKDLRQTAHFIADRVFPHVSDYSMDDWMVDWHRIQPNVRMRIVDFDGITLFDSQPWHSDPHAEMAPELLMDSKRVTENYRVALEIPFKNRMLVLSKERLLELPPHFYWYLLMVASLLSALIALISWPFAGRLGNVLDDSANLADKVADGHFGEQLNGVNRNDELGRLIRSLNHMSMQLLEAEAKNEALVADVSHELRSPLARIRVMNETLEYTKDEQRQSEIIALVEQEVTTLDGIVGDILTSGRLRRGEVEIRQHEVDLNRVLMDISQRYEPSLQSEMIKLELQLQPENAWCYCDQSRMEQVISNLLDNAIKAVRGSEHPKIILAIRYQKASGSFDVLVDDNGIGLSEKDKDRIFNRFYRADKSRSRQSGGVGLGLNIAQQLVTAMGGSLDVVTKKTSGVVFQIRGLKKVR